MRAFAIATTLAATAATAAAFPPEIDLASLLPQNGGDGSAGFRLDSGQTGDSTGYSVGGAGDFDGDGVDDMIVGSPKGAPDGHYSSMGYIVFGRDVVHVGDFPASFALLSLFPRHGGDGSTGFVASGEFLDQAGSSVSSTGDVNGDGIDDFVIGEPNSSPGGRNHAGSAYVVFGRDTAQSGDFPPLLPFARLRPISGGDGSDGFVIDGIVEDGGLGTAVSGAGDLNGDGIDDVVIGAGRSDGPGRPSSGATYVIFGHAAGGFPAQFLLPILLPANGGDGSVGFVLFGATSDFSGDALSAGGDVNGDGIDDLVIGAHLASLGGQSGAGASYVVFGRDTAQSGNFSPVMFLEGLLPAGGGDGSTGFVLAGIRESDTSGNSVDIAGDVNGDGIDDLLVGARDGGDAGQAYVVFGRDTARVGNYPALFPLRSLLPGQGGDGSAGVVFNGVASGYTGHFASVSGAGDINGDGVADIIMGEANAQPGGLSGAGRAFVVFGRSAPQRFPAVFPLANLLAGNGGDGSTGFALNGALAQDHTAASVSTTGDVNGDNIDDLIVGADVNAGTQPGGAWVVFGRREARVP